MTTRPTLVFDGDCGFCSTCARFIEARIPTSAAVIPWQRADLDALGVTAAACAEAVQWVPAEAGTAVESGSRAIGRLLVDAGSFWRLAGWTLLRPPVSWLAPAVYRWVARHRSQLPGGTAACAVPPASERPTARAVLRLSGSRRVPGGFRRRARPTVPGRGPPARQQPVGTETLQR